MPLSIALPSPAIVCSDGVAYSGSSGTIIANNVYLLSFELYTTATALSVAVRVGTTATGTTDGGIYDSSGNLLGHSGAITNVASTTMKNALTSALTLSPGQYFAGVTASNSTDTYIRISSTSGAACARERQATNTGTAGVLPATTGTLLPGATYPAIAVFFVGGLT